MQPILAFDIETVPDVEAGRRLYNLAGLDDGDTARAMFHRRIQQTGRDFLPLHLHRVCAISVALWRGEDFRAWSLGQPDESEGELIARFFDGVERYRPVLVTWNGSGFDLPVLHYRALFNGIQAPIYWETGGGENTFRWNNYLNRFHERHTDLMDVLAGYQGRAAAPLDEVAVMLGLPGKMGMHGSEVWDAYHEGRLDQIRDYCDTDALNTFLVYLHFQHMRGVLDAAALAREQARVRDFLRAEDKPHLSAFEQAWRPAEVTHE